MYKRETRFKGQKRVSVGRVTRNSEPLESRSKDSSRESSYEDTSRIVKCEPNFNDGSSADVTRPGVQVSETLTTLVVNEFLPAAYYYTRIRSGGVLHRW